MKELIEQIDEITKFGLEPIFQNTENEAQLEKNLVSIYQIYLSIVDKYDENEYSEFDISQFPKVSENIRINFPTFGFYNTILNIEDPINPENALGDAVDDLNDIIFDLLEVKWRLENNSTEDGIWFFKFIFDAHTKTHILDLLKYLNEK